MNCDHPKFSDTRTYKVLSPLAWLACRLIEILISCLATLDCNAYHLRKCRDPQLFERGAVGWWATCGLRCYVCGAGIGPWEIWNRPSCAIHSNWQCQCLEDPDAWEEGRYHFSSAEGCTWNNQRPDLAVYGHEGSLIPQKALHLKPRVQLVAKAQAGLWNPSPQFSSGRGFGHGAFRQARPYDNNILIINHVSSLLSIYS